MDANGKEIFMQDIITALVRKKQNLAEQKRHIEATAKARCKEIDGEILNIDNALNIINDAAKQFLCKACGGMGEVGYTDAAGSRDTKLCEQCKGTGVDVSTRKVNL